MKTDSFLLLFYRLKMEIFCRFLFLCKIGTRKVPNRPELWIYLKNINWILRFY